MRTWMCRPIRRGREFVGGLLAAGLALMMLFSGSGVAQPPGAPDEGPAGAALPEGLRHVPADAMGFVHFRLGEFLKSEAGQALREQLLREEHAGKIIKEIEGRIGVSLSEIDSVTLVVMESMLWELQPRSSGPGRAMESAVPFMEKMKAFPDKKFDFGPPPGKISAPKPPLPEDFPKPREALPKLERPPLEKPPKLQRPKAPDRDLPEDLDFESPVSFQGEVFGGPMMEYPMGGPLVILTTTKPVDRRKIIKRLLLPTDDEELDRRFHGEGGPSVLFLSERSFILGSPAALMQYSAQIGKETRGASRGFGKGPGGAPGGFGGAPAFGKGGAGAPALAPLRPVLALGAEPHLLVAGGHVPASIKQALLVRPPMHGPEAALFATFSPLANVASVGLTLDLGKTADLKIHLNGANPRSAALAGEAVKTGLALVDISMERLLSGQSDTDRDSPPPKLKTDLLKKIRKALSSVTTTEQGNTVQVHLRTEIDPATVTVTITELVRQIRDAGGRTQRTNNLKQIALAMHNYHDAYRGFPPAGINTIKSKDGRPLLSWRVAILPFIEEDQVYRQFDLNLPWDHPHNQKLIEKMPNIYVVPGVKHKVGMTHYQVFVGPGTVFEVRKDRPPVGLINARMADILDGTSNTLMVVEAADPVIWTKPDDLPYDPKQPLPKLGVFRDGFYAALCDGSVRFLRRNVPEQTLRALITRNGGEVIQGDF
jgi:hypothetical protein